MRLLNRLVVAVVLAALVVFGTFGAIYAFAGFGYQDRGLPNALATPENAQPALNWLASFENGSVPVLDFVIVVVLGVAGLALLVLEVRPRRKRHLRLGPGAWVRREVVQKEVEHVALSDPAVLECNATLIPHRLFRNKLKLDLTVRRGESPDEARHRVRDLVDGEIVGRGQVDIRKMKIKAAAKDPRQTKRRVK